MWLPGSVLHKRTLNNKLDERPNWIHRTSKTLTWAQFPALWLWPARCLWAPSVPPCLSGPFSSSHRSFPAQSLLRLPASSGLSLSEWAAAQHEVKSVVLCRCIGSWCITMSPEYFQILRWTWCEGVYLVPLFSMGLFLLVKRQVEIFQFPLQAPLRRQHWVLLPLHVGERKPSRRHAGMLMS